MAAHMDDSAAYRVADLAESILSGLRREPHDVSVELLARLLAEIAADIALAQSIDIVPRVVERARDYSRLQLATSLRLHGVNPELVDHASLSSLLDSIRPALKR